MSHFTVLCYGDSNTAGQKPGFIHTQPDFRMPLEISWPGILEKKLGEPFRIIVEGLSSRVTDFDDEKWVGRNGLTYFQPCLESHNPVDIVIIMLGTNDLKERFQRGAQQVAEGLSKYFPVIDNYGMSDAFTKPKVLFISPPWVDESVASTQVNYRGAQDKSKKLSDVIEEVAKKHHAEFLDAASIVAPSKEDGVHLDHLGHQELAEAVAEVVRSLTQSS